MAQFWPAARFRGLEDRLWTLLRLLSIKTLPFRVRHGGGTSPGTPGSDLMKLFSLLLLVLLAAVVAHGATPSFSSFNPAQFTTNNLRIGIKTNALSNTTTVISNSVVVITNTTIIVNGNTNNVGLWQNIAGTYSPTEVQNRVLANGITSANFLVTLGSLSDTPTTNATVAAGINNVSVFQQGTVVIPSSGTPGTTEVRISSGNGDGNYVTLMNGGPDGNGFTLFNGGQLYNAPGSFVHLPHGDWVTTNQYDGILLKGGGSGWFEVGRWTANTNVVAGDSLWEGVGRVAYLKPQYGSTIAMGTNAAWGLGGTSDGVVSVHDASLGESDFNSFYIAAIDQNVQENYGTILGFAGSGANAGAWLSVFAATNYQNLAAPISRFWAAVNPVQGEALLDLENNGIHEFAVSNQVTSVRALSLEAITNSILLAGQQNINVSSNSYIGITATNTDPTMTDVVLSTGLREKMFLVLENVGPDPQGFSLLNGTPCWDDPTYHVTLRNGNWITTNSGDCILLMGGKYGWTEATRFNNNTNVVTGDSLWELVGGHMRTTGNTTNDWQFRAYGTPVATIDTNATLTLTGGFFDIMAQTTGGNSFFEAYGSDAGDKWIQIYSPTAQNVLLLDPGADEAVLAGPAYKFDTERTFTTNAIATFMNHGTNIFDIGPDPRVVWGKSTNVTYWNDRWLTLTNPAAYSGYGVEAGDGSLGRFTAGGNLAQVQGTAGVNLVAGFPSGDELRWMSNRLTPLSTNNVFGGAKANGVDSPPIGVLNAQTNRVIGYQNGVDAADYSRGSMYHTGTNGVILLSSEASGIAGVARPFEINRNLGATLAVGSTTYVDMFQPSATNAIAGAMTFDYATNGLDLVEFTHVRTFFNGSGSDHTVNLPSGWHKGTGAGASFVVTNATMAKLYVTCMGPTGSAGLQTNVTATVAFFP